MKTSAFFDTNIQYLVTVTRKLGISAEFAQRKVEILSRGRIVRFEHANLVSAIVIIVLPSPESAW